MIIVTSTINLIDDFERFSLGLNRAAIERVVERHTGDAADAMRYFDIALAEARNTCALLAASGVSLRGRVLEVGAGVGLVSAFLRSMGVDCVGIEPVEEGFSGTKLLQNALHQVMGATAAHPLPHRADELSASEHGVFDLIFSVNVLEHMQPLEPNLLGLARVLSPEGMMLHSCPNYNFPYEPHFGVPLIPGAPAATAVFFRKAIREAPLWRSLNFITSFQIKDFCRRNGLSVEFERGQIKEALVRLRSDPAFAERHRGLASGLARTAYVLRLDRILVSIPPDLSTPMTFRLTHS